MTDMAGNARRARGRVAGSAGRLGEESVAREYHARGFRLIASRWRGRAGEIDLILEAGGEFVFVEVKKSADHARAAARILPRQIRRIRAAALVDGVGRVQILENALQLG
ncbi:MAG: YraN family protein [Paracoccus sp. (in: a-proteobacteria)]|uniref:YraN family protein n=1 Tax=Paracoccus sp. TaxID=267 RepID=UPI0039E2A359